MVLHRARQAKQGPLPSSERVPFDSFGNFEEGSHKQWFRPPGAVNATLDWGVIVAQSSVGRIVLVAKLLHEQAWLIELLVKLQTRLSDRATPCCKR